MTTCTLIGRFVRNVDAPLPNYTVSQTRKLLIGKDTGYRLSNFREGYLLLNGKH